MRSHWHYFTQHHQWDLEEMLGQPPGLSIREVGEGPMQDPFRKGELWDSQRQDKVTSFFPPIVRSSSNVLLRALKETLVRGLQDFQVASVGNKVT